MFIIAMISSSLTESFPSLNYLAEHDEQPHHQVVSLQIRRILPRDTDR